MLSPHAYELPALLDQLVSAPAADSTTPTPPPIDDKLPTSTWTNLSQRIVKDPAFAISTFDSEFWIDPYHGALVHRIIIDQWGHQSYFRSQRHWIDRRPKSIAELHCIRWRYFLRQAIPAAPELRIFNFDNGSWLNPYTGMWDDTVSSSGIYIHEPTLTAMANALANAGALHPSLLMSERTILNAVDARLRHDLMLSSQANDEELYVLISDDGGYHISEERPSADQAISERYRRQTGKKNAPPPPTADTTSAHKEPQTAFALPQPVCPTSAIERINSNSNNDDNSASATPGRSNSRIVGWPEISDEELTPLSNYLLTPQPDAPHDTNTIRPARHDDLEQARLVQNKIMDLKLKPLPRITPAVIYKPHEAVSGDFYDVRPLSNNRLFVMLGDVSGHGIQAGLVSCSMVRSARQILRQHDDLVDIVCLLNDTAREDCIAGQFITLWAGILDLDNKRIDAVCAGHHPALLSNPRTAVPIKRIGERGPALGLLDNVRFRSSIAACNKKLYPGDTLTLYSDGLHEASNGDSAYGHQGVIACLLAHLNDEPQALSTALYQEVRSFADNGTNLNDDVTVLNVQYS
ncbi:MAG: PP2C family protein-serine/threonine phosphatase [Planctomycetota bacterium]|jgi:hypothetical protein